MDKNLPTLSWKVQLEVLDNCPMDIIKAHSHLLHERAKKALGLEDEPTRKKTRMTAKELSYFDWR